MALVLIFTILAEDDEVISTNVAVTNETTETPSSVSSFSASHLQSAVLSFPNPNINIMEENSTIAPFATNSIQQEVLYGQATITPPGPQTSDMSGRNLRPRIISLNQSSKTSTVSSPHHHRRKAKKIRHAVINLSKIGKQSKQPFFFNSPSIFPEDPHDSIVRIITIFMSSIVY